MLKSLSHLLTVGILSSLAVAQTATPAPASQPATTPATAQTAPAKTTPAKTKTKTKAKSKAAPKPATTTKTATTAPATATPATAKPATPKSASTKPTTMTPATIAKPATAVKKPTTTPKPATTANKAPAPAPKAAAKTPVAKKPEVKVAEKPKPSAAKAPAADEKVKTVALDPHRRDPFLNPLQEQENKMRNTAACTTGARCLMIDQVVLKGVVKTQAGMIAMVENSARKQYNLREKDPVYNGFVLKITGDTIVFKETSVDTLGKSTSKEVVKRVTVPAV